MPLTRWQIWQYLPLSCGQMKIQILSGILSSHLQFAKLLKVAKLIDLWMSDNLLSTLLWYERIFRFWATASSSFRTLTNSQLFGMNSRFAVLLTTWDFRDSSSQYCFATSANWPDMAGPVFLETRFLLVRELWDQKWTIWGRIFFMLHLIA